MMLKRDDFEYWLAIMDDEINEFLKNIPTSLSDKLDYSQNSLLAIEKWVLDSYDTVEEIMHDNQKIILDRISRYVGETFIKNIDGIWNINLKDKKDIYYQIPIIEFKKGKKIIAVECPVSLITASVDRRAGDYINKVFSFIAVARQKASR